jgi:solute carrier family 30 (zinc transporter), member 1
MLAILFHVVGDAINNIGVIIAAVIIWKTTAETRFYADPAVSSFIAIMIILTAGPVVKNSGQILLQSAPSGLVMEDLKHDIEKVRYTM